MKKSFLLSWSFMYCFITFQTAAAKTVKNTDDITAPGLIFRFAITKLSPTKNPVTVKKKSGNISFGLKSCFAQDRSDVTQVIIEVEYPL